MADAGQQLNFGDFDKKSISIFNQNQNTRDQSTDPMITDTATDPIFIDFRNVDTKDGEVQTKKDFFKRVRSMSRSSNRPSIYSRTEAANNKTLESKKVQSKKTIDVASLSDYADKKADSFNRRSKSLVRGRQATEKTI